MVTLSTLHMSGSLAALRLDLFNADSEATLNKRLSTCGMANWEVGKDTAECCAIVRFLRADSSQTVAIMRIATSSARLCGGLPRLIALAHPRPVLIAHEPGAAPSGGRPAGLAASGDAVLVASVCAGDPEAAEELFVRRCGRVIAALARRFQFEDLLGDLYLWLREDDWRRLRGWREEGALEGWIRVVATNRCREFGRQQGRNMFVDPEHLEAFWNPDAPGPEHRLCRSELLQAIEQLCDPRQRYILYGVLADRAPEEMARDLKITRDNVDKLKSRALLAIKQWLDGQAGPGR